MVLKRVQDELTRAFGGVTMHVNAPAKGLWKNKDDLDHDRIVVVEVMTDDLEKGWWAKYRGELEARLDQDEVMIRAAAIERL